MQNLLMVRTIISVYLALPEGTARKIKIDGVWKLAHLRRLRVTVHWRLPGETRKK